MMTGDSRSRMFKLRAAE